MVNTAKAETAQAEKLLKEANGKIDVLQAEVKAQGAPPGGPGAQPGGSVRRDRADRCKHRFQHRWELAATNMFFE